MVKASAAFLLLVIFSMDCSTAAERWPTLNLKRLEKAMHYLEINDHPEVDPHFSLSNPLLVLAWKEPWVLQKALDAYPLELEGQSQYETNYTLTEECSRALGVYHMGIKRMQHWAAWSKYNGRPIEL